MLRESKMIRGNVVGLKVLGNGELKHALSVEAHKVSASAREKIEKAGGSVTLRESRRPRFPIEAKVERPTAAPKKTPAAPKKAPIKKTAAKKKSKS